MSSNRPPNDKTEPELEVAGGTPQGLISGSTPTSFERALPADPSLRIDPNEHVDLDPPMESGEIGRLLHYRVLRLIGTGGMGRVYEAVDTQLQRRVALKIMHSTAAADPNSRQRFFREAQAVASLVHENL